MPKLTAKFIKSESEAQFPERGQLILRDDELKGFGLRITPRCMSYIVEGRVNGSPKRVTLARYEEMSPDEARKKARVVLAKMATQKPVQGSVPMLEEVLDKYIEVRKLSKNTLRNYVSLTRRCLGDWYGLPVTSITRDMVLTRHKELTRTTKQGSKGQIQANIIMVL